MFGTASPWPSCRLDAPVLLTGATGTERSFWLAGSRSEFRAQGPFIAVNMAAVPESLFEADLFGVEKGRHGGQRAQARQFDGRGTCF